MKIFFKFISNFLLKAEYIKKNHGLCEKSIDHFVLKYRAIIYIFLYYFIKKFGKKISKFYIKFYNNKGSIASSIVREKQW